MSRPVREALIERGYRIDSLLADSGHSTVYRLLALDGSPRIAKCIPDTSSGGTARYRHEYALNTELEDVPLPRALDLTALAGHWVILFEDDLSESLDRDLPEQGLPLDEAVQVVREAAAAVAALHRHGIVHRDINPSNLIRLPASFEVRLIDLGLAARMPLARSPFVSPHRIEGTLAYMAPEQAGRTNRLVDHRADLYALGVTAFELLTGTRPFTGDDPLTLLHQHVATPPPPPSQLVPGLPEILDRIVLRLLAKRPDDRYASADGLVADLDAVLDGRAGPDFELGHADVHHAIRFSGELYGRASERRALVDQLRRAADGASAVALIAGFSGVGKSSLVRELRPDLAARRAPFFEAKYDVAGEATALQGIGTLLTGLADHLLAEPDDALARWRRRAREALGEEGLAAVLAVAPRLGAALDATPPTARASEDLSVGPFGVLAQAVGRLLRAWAREAPLVLFLDDLQWADPADLTLLRDILEGEGLPGVLVVGAYRDNEVPPGHPLHTLVRSLSEPDPGRLAHLHLAPLGPEPIRAWLDDLLGLPGPEQARLTETILARTDGNPFFTRRLLTRLHREGVLVHRGRDGWRLDGDPLEAVGPSENVVAWLLDDLDQLDADTTAILRVAALLGASFPLAPVARTLDREPAAVAEALQHAAERGLIAMPASSRAVAELAADPSGEVGWSLRAEFIHDRVQQGILDRTDDATTQQLRHRLGWVLAARAEQAREPAWRVQAVAHLHAAPPSPERRDLRHTLVHLDLLVARQARSTARFGLAARTATDALALLADLAADPDDLTPELTCIAAEAAALDGAFDEADRLHARLDAMALEERWRLRALSSRLDQALLQQRFAEGVDVALRLLDLLGLTLPADEDSARERRLQVSEQVTTRLAAHGPSALSRGPWSTATRLTSKVHALYGLFLSAYLSGRGQLGRLPLALTALVALEEGLAPMSGYGIVGYAMLLTLESDDPQLAHAIARQGIAVTERYDDEPARAKTNFLFAADVHNWTQPIADSLPYYDRAWTLALRTGDWLTAGYVAMQSGSDLLTLGWPLERLEARVRDHIDLLVRRHNEGAVLLTRAGVLQPLLHLRGRTRHWDSFDSDGFDEAGFVEQHADNPFYLAWLYSGRIRAAVFQGEASRAHWRTWADRVPVLFDNVPSHTKVPEAACYGAILRCWLAADAEGPEREADLATADALLDDLRRWAAAAPANLQAKLALAEAERARVAGDVSRAVARYEDAAAAAEEHDQWPIRALADELAARFWRDRGRSRVARRLLQEALDAYRQWGADGKVEALQAELDLDEASSLASLEEAPTQVAERPATARSTQGLPHAQLDLAALARAAGRIADDPHPEQVLRALCATAAQSAGARAVGVFFDHAWVARAEDGAFRRPGAEASLLRDGAPDRLVRRAMRTGDEARDRVEEIEQAALPLRVAGTVRGALWIAASEVSRDLHPDGVRLLTQLASYIAATLANATLVAELEASNARLQRRQQTQEGLVRLTGRLVHSTGTDEDLDQSLRDLAGLLGAERCAVLLDDGSAGHRTRGWPALVDADREALGAAAGLDGGTDAASLAHDVEHGGRSTRLGPDERDGGWLLVQTPRVGTGRALLLARRASDDPWAEEARWAARMVADTLAALQRRLRADHLVRLGEQTRQRTMAATVAGLAHELNTPLGVALTAESVLQMETEALVEAVPDLDTSRLLRASGLIGANVRRAADLIRTFKTVVFEQTVDEVRDLDPVSFVRDLLQTLAPLLRTHQLTVHLDAPTAPLHLRCVPGRLAQVLTNLIENAGVHAYDGAGGPLRLQFAPLDDGVRLIVEDDGVGMDDATRETCLDPFFTTRRSGGGTGLGLFVVRRVVETELHGEVGLETAPGEGCRWRLDLRGVGPG